MNCPFCNIKAKIEEENITDSSKYFCDNHLSKVYISINDHMYNIHYYISNDYNYKFYTNIKQPHTVVFKKRILSEKNFHDRFTIPFTQTQVNISYTYSPIFQSLDTMLISPELFIKRLPLLLAFQQDSFSEYFK